MLIYLLAFFLVAGSLTALSVKWELNKKIAVSWALFMGICSCVFVAFLQSISVNISPLQQLLSATFAPAIVTLAVMFGVFFRDPERTAPVEQGAIISPADGTVRYVKEIRGNEFPFALKKGSKIPLTAFTELDLIQGGGIQIGISMTFLDVHVTRAPITGEFIYLRRIPGKFRSLKSLASLLENERVVGLIKGSETNIGIVLIASRLVRRIAMRLNEGQNVIVGQRIGMIRFGSQVDILIPQSDSLKVTVGIGDKVTAGKTILARL